jgi:alkylation response protein AidB-like acyl-CoA dehydrogenase
MDFSLSEEERSIVAEVREYIAGEATDALREELATNETCYGGPLARAFVKPFASKGWLVPNWPREYGGLESSEMVSYLIRDELAHADIVIAFAGAHMGGPMVLRDGSEAMKQEFLPRLASGEIEFCLGYTEPGAGSDLMGLKMRAEDKGDHFLVNGQKIFNTHAHVADYHWLAVRTDPSVPKHHGISILVVDLDSPGITVRPLHTMAGSRTNEVFYDDVRVPKDRLLGEMNKGMRYIMGALDYERMFLYGQYENFFNELLAYVKTTMIDGKPASQDPLIRQRMAQMRMELEVCRLMYFQLACMLDKDTIPSYQSSMEKMFVTEYAQRLADTALEILGQFGQLTENSKEVRLRGRAEQLYRKAVVETIYGGSSEIQRNIIAQRGLRLPRD